MSTAALAQETVPRTASSKRRIALGLLIAAFLLLVMFFYAIGSAVHLSFEGREMSAKDGQQAGETSANIHHTDHKKVSESSL